MKRRHFIAGLMAFAAAIPAMAGDAAKLVDVWNGLVSSFDEENPKLTEIQTDYIKYDPRRIVLTGDVRAAQRSRHVKLLNESVALHDDQTAALKQLAKIEERL